MQVVINNLTQMAKLFEITQCAKALFRSYSCSVGWMAISGRLLSLFYGERAVELELAYVVVYRNILQNIKAYFHPPKCY